MICLPQKFLIKLFQSGLYLPGGFKPPLHKIATPTRRPTMSRGVDCNPSADPVVL